ncbi:hypothetical protein C8Q79DRAFT_923413 [Trametes meyenii]|nr:hypothetical protein C8Q79DRAFT_923413 [Trametes meyenii]
MRITPDVNQSDNIGEVRAEGAQISGVSPVQGGEATPGSINASSGSGDADVEWPISPFGQRYKEDVLHRVSKQLKWGSAKAGLDEVLCNDGRPAIFMLVGEVEHAAFYDEYDKPEKFVRISIKPMYHSDLMVAHNMLRNCCHNVKTRPNFSLGVIEAARKQTRKTRNMRGTEAYKFKHAYDASNGYGPKSTMTTISPSDIGYRDLVLIECKMVRFRVDHESGKATYYMKDWASWRCRFDIVSVCRLRVGEDEVDSADSDDENVPVV